MATLRGGSTAPDTLTGDLGRPLPWAAPSRQEKAGAPMPSVHRTRRGRSSGFRRLKKEEKDLYLLPSRALLRPQGECPPPCGSGRVHAGLAPRLPLGQRAQPLCEPSTQRVGREKAFSLPGLKLPHSRGRRGIRGLGSNGRCELRALILGRKSPLGPAPGSQQLWRDPRVVPAPPPPLGAPGPGVPSHGVWFTHSPLQVKLPLPPGSGVNHVTGPISQN